MALKNKKGIGILVIAIIIIIIGVIGCVFCVGGIVSVKNLKLDLTETTELTASVKGGLDSATTLVGNLAIALRNSSLTIREAKNSLYNVSDVSDDTAKVIQTIAEAIDFNLFGFQPLSGASEYFESVGYSVQDIGGNINNIADNIDVNADDVDKIAGDLENLSVKLRDISNNFENAVTTLPDFGFKKMLYALLYFGGALSLAFILVGAAIILLNRRINLYLIKS